MKHQPRKKRGATRSGLRAKQRVVQFADRFKLIIHVMIVRQPTLDLPLLLGPDADLLVTAAGVIDRAHPHRMSVPASAGVTALLIPKRAIQQGPTHERARRPDPHRQLGASTYTGLNCDIS